MCVYRCAGLYICVCGRVSDGCVCGCADVCIRVRVYVYKYIYVYESEQGASKEREPAGGEEKTETKPE